MSQSVTIVDYGMGNLYSVSRAFETCGATVILSSDPEKISLAERLILPGVGAFGNAMMEVRTKNLLEPLLDYPRKERPFLGICLGMQMMMEESDEFGNFKGLGFIGGKVKKIPDRTKTGEKLLVPHIGWNPLQFERNLLSDPGSKFLAGLPDKNSYVYFVHSFMAVPEKENEILATTNYGDRDIVSIIQTGSMFGCQFHPERSGRIGLHIIKNFLSI